MIALFRLFETGQMLVAERTVEVLTEGSEIAAARIPAIVNVSGPEPGSAAQSSPSPLPPVLVTVRWLAKSTLIAVGTGPTRISVPDGDQAGHVTWSPISSDRRPDPLRLMMPRL